MNDFFQRRCSNRGLRVFWTLIVLPTFFFTIFETAFAADPAQQKKNVEAQARELETAGKKSADSPQAARSRPVQEINDGALPESEQGFFELSEEANDAQNWFDPVKSKELRAEALKTARRYRETWPNFPKIDVKKAESLGLRTVESGRILMYTDLPKSEEVDQIPEALDAAIPHICKFFEIDESQFDDLRVEAFLMGDVNPFIEIHALNGPPRFLYGYSMGDRIYAKDQKLGYYNRFLLLHELVHSLMHEIFGDLRPRWFSEGSAEYLALHEWDSKRKEIKIAQIPKSAESTPGFGRLRQIQEIVASKRAPTLFEILNFEPRDFVNVSTYSWSWAFVMFLNNSPKYKEIAEVLPYWSITEEPNRLFVDAIEERWNELENDWADFIGRIDYNYDFQASSIGAALKPSEMEEVGDEARVEIDASRGWQDSGLRLHAGSSYRLACAGRFKFYLSEAKRVFDFEGTGATCQYAYGKPIGRLEAVVVPDTDELTFYQIYGIDDEESGKRPDNLSGFRFNAFQKMRASSNRTRFGENSSGFDDESALLEGSQTSRRGTGQFSLQAPLYNALYPWNSGVEFSTMTVRFTPSKTGKLYLRVNAISSDLKRNSGSIKVQIKPENTN